MKNKKLYNLALMLSILVLHTITLTYWLSKDGIDRSKKKENSFNINFERPQIIPAVNIKRDSAVFSKEDKKFKNLITR